jgi:hypothetical protein
MDVAEGFLYIVIILEIIACFMGAVLLGIIYAILTRMKDRFLRLGILVLAAALGFVVLMGIDAPMLLTGALIFVVPVSVLVPPFVFPGRTGVPPGFGRILLCYVVVSVIGIFLPFLLVMSGLSMVPEIFWHTPLSNGMIYACVTALDTGLASLMYRVIATRKVIPKE